VAKRYLSKVAEKIATRYGLEVVRGYLLKRIEEVTPDHIYQAIKDGVSVWPLMIEADKKRAKRWAKRFAKYRDQLTANTVLMWLSEDRPELASVIINMPNKQGIKWLIKEVKEIKSKLWPD